MSKEKQIAFRETLKRHTDLKVRLKHEGLTQSAFFRLMIDKVLEQDPRILDIIDDHKKEKELQSKRTMEIIEEKRNEGREIEKKFGIGDKEIQSIYDAIEEDDL